MSKLGLFYVPFLLLFVTKSFAQTMVPNFTANQTAGCVGLAVQFTDQTTGNPKFWNWDFGNGTLSNVQNPVVVFNAAGIYDVTLVVRNADGTTGTTKQGYITITSSPSAGFSSNLTIGCMPSTIQFFDNSAAPGGSIVSWQWDFGDGTTSTEQNPTKSYDKVGFYNVSLVVTSNTGCKAAASRARYIRIVPGVKAEFDNSKSVTCRPPFNITFTNLSTGPGNMTYQWDLGNGVNATDTNPSTAYNTSATYNVTLTATSQYGCSNTITKPLTLTGPTMSINAPDTVCQNAKVFFRNITSVTPQKVRWDFGNGEIKTGVDDSTVYPMQGDYTIKLINTFSGCTDSATKQIYVRSSPDIDFRVLNAESCKTPLTVTFEDASPAPIVDWRWDFGDGSTGTGSPTTHTYNSSGDYNVGVIFTDDKGCEGRISKPAVVKIQKPVVAIKNVPDGGCIPFDWIPDDSVQTLDGVVSWQWDFGDGGTSTSPTPTHRYSTAGTYDVRLTITTRDGCTETVFYNDAIRTGTPPTVNFTVPSTDVCASEQVRFTDQSTPATTINRWKWEFGDGGSSSEQNPLYKFQDTGSFQVILTAYNNGCPEQSAPQTIRVRPPIAKFEYNVTCGAFTVNFVNRSIVDPTLGPLTYSWNFGDGSPADGTQSPTHVFPNFGTYPVTLTVTNGACTDVITTEVVLVQTLPDFTISKNPGCKNQPTAFNSLNTPATIELYEWSFDGGTTWGASDADTTVTFTADGTYNVIMRITDLNGCVYTKNASLVISSPVPRATANITGGCANTLVTFTDNSTPAGTITHWNFDFGDGTAQTFTTAPFTHQYRDTGAFVIKLNVQDNRGCTDTWTLTDTIFIGKPMADFTSNLDTVCPASAVQFEDLSAGRGMTYQWQFGDGNTSTLQNPSHTYGGNENTYNVQLIVTDRGGCTDTLIQNRFITTIRPKPAFDIADTTTICPPIETKFTFKGKDYADFYWDFGDGFESSLQNPTHFYNDYGMFTPTLYLIGYGGCIETASQTVNVYNPNTSTTFNYSPTDACNELLVDFNISTPPSTTFTFVFGDGTTATDQKTSFQHFYGSPAFYSPAIVLLDQQDCQVSVGGPVVIKVIGAEPFFGVDTKRFCDEGSVNFTNFTIGNDPVVSRTWDFGDGSATTSDEHPTHFYAEPGLYVPKQTVTTQTGCVKTIEDTIRVYRTPEPTILGDSVACINEPSAYRGTLAFADTAVAWTWSMGSFHSNTQDIVHNFPESGDYVLKLTASNLLGCADSTQRNLYVPPTPEINIQSNPVTIPVTTGITLPVTYSENIDSYLWTPDKNLSCTDCPTPFANPKLTTTYKIRVQDIFGCTNQKDLTVNVICTGLNYFLPNTFSPNGDGVNDIFAPRGNGLTRVNSMRIFNRWGEQVFEKMNFLANDRTPTGGWDGTFKGKPASADVYVYIIEFVCENASVVPVRGNVALIR